MKYTYTLPCFFPPESVCGPRHPVTRPGPLPSKKMFKFTKIYIYIYIYTYIYIYI